MRNVFWKRRRDIIRSRSTRGCRHRPSHAAQDVGAPQLDGGGGASAYARPSARPDAIGESKVGTPSHPLPPRWPHVLASADARAASSVVTDISSCTADVRWRDARGVVVAGTTGALRRLPHVCVHFLPRVVHARHEPVAVALSEKPATALLRRTRAFRAASRALTVQHRMPSLRMPQSSSSLHRRCQDAPWRAVPLPGVPVTPLGGSPGL